MQQPCLPELEAVCRALQRAGQVRVLPDRQRTRSTTSPRPLRPHPSPIFPCLVWDAVPGAELSCYGQNRKPNPLHHLPGPQKRKA